MATLIGDLGRARKGSLFARRPFLRPGEKDLAFHKNRRRRVLRARHVIALLALQAVFFLAVREAYLFLITWDELAIRKIDFDGAGDGLRRTLESRFAGPRLGNILLCDLQAVRADVRRLAWVKDASVQKVFPTTLRITVVERTPFALLERDGLFLADEEGWPLERVPAREGYDLPVVSDENGFSSGFYEKWGAARRCLEGLPPSERDLLLGVRCGDYGSLELAFKDDSVRVIVGAEAPAEDLARFRRGRPGWEAHFGPLACVNLSFEGRVYVRAAEPAGDGVPQPDKGD